MSSLPLLPNTSLSAEEKSSTFTSTSFQPKILKAHSGGGGGGNPERRLQNNRHFRKNRLPSLDQPQQAMNNSTVAKLEKNLQKTGNINELHAMSQSATLSAFNNLSLSSTSSSNSTAQLLGLPGMDMQSSASPLLSDKQTLCIDLLVNGHVNSFVDFFYLTHRAEDDALLAAAAAAAAGIATSGSTDPAAFNAVNAATNAANTANATPTVPPHKLNMIKELLATAETAHRRGDSEQVYESYEALAHDFHGSSDYKTAIYFYEKCLDLAEQCGDLAQQCSSNLNLGLTHDKMGDIQQAILFHERHLEIARRMGAQSRILLANQQLVEAYRRFAEEHARREDWLGAVTYYKKCQESSVHCNDVRSEGLATYRLGIAAAKAYPDNKNLSVEYLQKYLAICKRLGDQLGEGAACAALAESFKEMGDNKLAVSYLEKYHQIAARNKQAVAQAEACAALGDIFSVKGDHPSAVHYFEKTFDIARSVGDRKLVDNARIHLGMARGNMSMNKYMGVVKDNLPALLNWKTKRQAFKS